MPILALHTVLGILFFLISITSFTGAIYFFHGNMEDYAGKVSNPKFHLYGKIAVFWGCVAIFVSVILLIIN